MLCSRRVSRLAGSCYALARVRNAKHTATPALRRQSDPATLLVNSMTDILPRFELEAKDISILANPSEFYDHVLAMIARAQKRIHISSLYIGETENQLLAALSNALAKNEQLQVTIQLDALRSTRSSKTQASPVHLLLPLIDAYPDRVKVRLFRSPKLNGLLRCVVPRRFDEGWGTWHAKVYLADDEVVLSGANLSTSYFTDRQDRYIHIASAPQFTSYLVRLLQMFSEYSFRLDPAPGTSLGYNLAWTHPQLGRFDFAERARDSIMGLQQSELSRTPSITHMERPNITPIVQAGFLGIREEEQALERIFDLLETPVLVHSLVDLTSGYFALYGPYQDRMLKSQADYRIVAASPEANGFLGSRGLSGRIPSGYTLLEKRFWERVLAARREWARNGGIELSEWRRPGWTYHAKGIWLSPSPSQPPYATLFGSTNLNSRSAHLDTEISFILSVPDREISLRAALRNEIVNIRKHASRVDSDTFSLPERRVSLITRTIVGLVGSML